MLELVSLDKSSVDFRTAKAEKIGPPSLGDVIRQGDVFLVNVEYNHNGVSLTEKQIAPGNTQGSRHVMRGQFSYVELGSVEAVHNVLPKVIIPSELSGCIINCISECELDHPEHGNKILPANTSWAVVFQRAYLENEIRRIQD